MKECRLLLADDHEMIIEGLLSYFENVEGISIIETASSGKIVLEKLKNETLPNILILDLNIPEPNGIELAKRIKFKYPFIKILIYSMHGQKEFVRTLLELGVSGYVLKTCSKIELIKAVKAIHNEERYVCADVKSSMMGTVKDTHMADSATNSIKDKSLDLLSKREKEVLCLVANGASTLEIAEKLFISTHTVNTHRKKILQKTKLKNAADLTLLAFDSGLLERFDIR